MDFNTEINMEKERYNEKEMHTETEVVMYKATEAGADTQTKKEIPDLWLTITAGPESVVACAGEYQLEPGWKLRGRPLWKHASSERWLYLGTDERWYIGDREEYDMNF